METTFIYALLEPGTKQIRYVGKANNPKARFSFHIHQSIKFRSHLGSWLTKLKSLKEKPDMEILDEVPRSQWGFWEREYIRVFRLIGFDLVNESDGGQGVGSGKENHMSGRTGTAHSFYGKTHSPEAREKISRTNLGLKRSPETRQKMRDAQRARRIREEQS